MRISHPFRGGNISYEVKGEGKSVVLLHGFLANATLWRDIAPRLAKQYRLFLIDLPGHGKSSSYGYIHSMEFMAEAVHSILKKHRIRKVSLIGHSLGGYVALAFAENNPDMLRGLLLINSTAKADNSKRKQKRNQFKKVVQKNKSKAISLIVPSLFQLKNRKRPYFLQRYLTMAKQCNIQGILANVEGMKNRKEREIVLKFAPYPFAYLIGEKDHLLKAADLLEESKLNAKGSGKLIERGSHMLPIEATEKTFAAIKLFLKQLRL